MKQIISAVAAVLFVSILSASPALAVTIHVPVGQSTIQAGIDAALDGDLVLVSPGTYVENIGFSGKAIILRSEAGAPVTIIDGDQAGSVVTFASGETEAAVLDGFTIRNGRCSDSCNYGGGIYCSDISSPTIANCTILDNYAHRGGGGIYCSASSPIITDCMITQNDSSAGGGIYCIESSPFIANCTISMNGDSLQGGGIYCEHASPLLSNCLIERNDGGVGGGINLSYSSPTIEKCTIQMNRAQRFGGGIYCYDSFPEITNCAIKSNVAVYRGGGLRLSASSPNITNCTIWLNKAQGEHEPSGRGGGLYIDVGSHPRIRNSIIWSNHATIDGDQIHGVTGRITYSDIQGGWPGVGNIDADPLFVYPWVVEYHLTADSPCIDAGTDAGVSTDMDGDRRPYGAGFDMGADEFISDFTLVADAFYEEETISLNFFVGLFEPATWGTFLILTCPSVQIIPLWAIPLSVIDPPISIPISHTFPSMGWIGILTGLHTEEGVQIQALDWVDTGN